VRGGGIERVSVVRYSRSSVSSPVSPKAPPWVPSRPRSEDCTAIRDSRSIGPCLDCDAAVGAWNKQKARTEQKHGPRVIAKRFHETDVHGYGCRVSGFWKGWRGVECDRLHVAHEKGHPSRNSFPWTRRKVKRQQELGSAPSARGGFVRHVAWNQVPANERSAQNLFKGNIPP